MSTAHSLLSFLLSIYYGRCDWFTLTQHLPGLSYQNTGTHQPSFILMKKVKHILFYFILSVFFTASLLFPVSADDTFPTDPDEELSLEPVEEEFLMKSSASPSVIYNTHVQSYGWMAETADGQIAGTTGKAKRLEAMTIRIDGNADLGISYQTHVQTYGWTDWVDNGAVSGTEGESKRLEAIRICLTGNDKDNYDIYYCVHVQSYGWMDWVSNGAAAGTQGESKRLEGICIMLVKKGDPIPWYPGSAETESGRPSVAYRVHVQSYGWMNTVENGATAGTQGESKRLEAFTAELKNSPYSGSIQYRTHIQNIGWETDWCNTSEKSGTVGQSKRLEAIQIRLSGEIAEHYDIYYRTHVQKIGWLGWAKNGESAGSEGFSYRMEAIQICLTPKEGAAPGSSENAFVSFIPSQLPVIDALSDDNSITCFGGYTLSDPLRERLESAIASAREKEKSLGFILVDIRTGQGIAYNPDERYYGASTIKAPYIASVVFSDPSSVDKNGPLMQSALKQSSNYAYTVLRQTYGPGPMQIWAGRAGISDADLQYSLFPWCSARDLAKLWLVNYAWFESGGIAGTVASWMEDPNLSAIRPVLGNKYTIRSKAGWKASFEHCFNDAGIIYAENGPYILAIMTDYDGGGESRLSQLVEVLDDCHQIM